MGAEAHPVSWPVSCSPVQEWWPGSWRSRPAAQQASYANPVEVERSVRVLADWPGLVASGDVELLKTRLAGVAGGSGFLLQSGDCAERFADSTAPAVAARLALISRLAQLVEQSAGIDVLRVGRMAGQYAKPRSDAEEVRRGVRLPSYRGDLINRPEFGIAARAADPALLLRGYRCAASTLASLNGHSSGPGRVFMSHEGLHLAYEEALTRRCPGGWYDLSTHFPWIGMRTSQPGGAHVEYFRGIRNPVALKVGPAMTPELLVRLLETLHPENEPGRLTIIHRFGCGRIDACLPPLIDAAARAGKRVLWACDPMHGNTRRLASGLKTRYLDDILAEVHSAFGVHNACGSRLGGVHLEIAAEDVTECVGCGIEEQDLSRAYTSPVDPRLNPAQAMEVARFAAYCLRR